MIDLSKFLDYPMWFKLAWIIWIGIGFSLGISSLFVHPVTKTSVEPTKNQSIAPSSKSIRHPDIVLTFEDRKALSFRVANLSNVVAREIQYRFELWDLDFQLRPDGSDPGYRGIHKNKIEWIRSADSTEAITLESLMSPLFFDIPDGHTILGWATIQCADCSRRRDYWLFWKKGESSWYAEVRKGGEASIVDDILGIRQSGPRYEDALSQLIPQNQRITVR